MDDMYDQDLDRNPANYVPLSPLTFLERTASVYPERVALIHGARRQSWGETYRRCRQLASALVRRGIGKGDTVAVILPNIPEMLEVHFGVPMTGAVLNTLNTRLDPAALAYMLDHARAKVLITDHEFSDIVAKALELVESKPLVVDVDDPLCDSGQALGELDYEAFIAVGDPEFVWSGPSDEWQAISLNYTSGTTGKPKGGGLSSSRRLSERGRQCPGLVAGRAPGLSVDSADVSLQRLVLPLDHRRHGRHPGLSAQGRAGSGARADS